MTGPRSEAMQMLLMGFNRCCLQRLMQITPAF